MIEIEIEGKKYFFEEKELTYDNAKILDKKVAKENLLLMKNVLDSNKVDFIIGYGTLLGAIRENDFINHDIDIDIIAFSENDVILCIPKLKSVGLNLVRLEKKQGTYSFMRNNVYIDIYVKREYKSIVNTLYVNLLGRPFPRKFLKSFIDIEFLGEKFIIPLNWEKLLVYWYGKDWNIPKVNSPSDDEANITKMIKKLLSQNTLNKIKKIIR